MFDDHGRQRRRGRPVHAGRGAGLGRGARRRATSSAVVADERAAREMAERRASRRARGNAQTGQGQPGRLFTRCRRASSRSCNIIIKADVQGSVEALRGVLEKLSTDEVEVKHHPRGRGRHYQVRRRCWRRRPNGDHYRLQRAARRDGPPRGRAGKRGDPHLQGHLRSHRGRGEGAAGHAGAEYREVVLGHAEVRALFRVPNVGVVAGCVRHRRQDRARLAGPRHPRRRGRVRGRVASLRRFKDDVREVAQGYECGIGIEKFNDLKEGDVIEVFRIEEVARQAQ